MFVYPTYFFGMLLYLYKNKVMKKCAVCENEFLETNIIKYCCSKKCSNEKRNKDRQKKPIEFECVICNTKFTQKRKDNLTCSGTCSQKLWTKNNPEKDWERQNGKDAKVRRKKWIEKNYDVFRKTQNKSKLKRYHNDINYKIQRNVSNLIKAYFKKKNIPKRSKTLIILGCSYEDFRQHLESQFQDWMSWDNHGKYEKDKFNIGWDIDHIIPLDSAKIEEDIIRLNHYTNLQPLCSKINRDIKRNLTNFNIENFVE